MSRHLADRFLHVCYNCDESQLPAVVEFFTSSLSMREVIRSPSTVTSGALLGIEGSITSSASFLYDARGPRRSPAIEVQGWRHPAVCASPLQHPNQVGIHAVGFAAESAAGVAFGIRTVDRNRGSWPNGLHLGRGVVCARDERGVAIDVVTDDAVGTGVEFAHVRIHCRDIGASLDWYERFGFHVVQRNGEDDDSRWARLCLAQRDLAILLIEIDPRLKPIAAPDTANHAGLFRCATRVEDVDRTLAELKGRDISPVSGPSAVALSGTALAELVIAIVRDPDGIPFELVQRPSSVFR
jgi:catechol 2,3-dioxygenase-like lactoylglutathione lyase family enzyme